MRRAHRNSHSTAITGRCITHVPRSFITVMRDAADSSTDKFQEVNQRNYFSTIMLIALLIAR
ncbi:MAG: hypothetical protein OXO49_03025 [Gammaproteobacteria bacterium]|nr:hypothetical protein [Gammaproteobacteria bacterium]MDE0253081.1 hypothetical protein [Gammaproteobacteria bacterium]MDE0402275.1 hypothetical protein [Gammaproteobacteria bacterium]